MDLNLSAAYARNFTYMFYGFSAAWVILVIYVFLLVSREKRLEREIAALKRMLEEKEGK
jgi:CcmD family protein